MLLRDAEVRGRRTDVLVKGPLITRLGAGIEADEVIDCRGGALLPGLHDHHCHLLATAAARESVACGPPDVTSRSALMAALRRPSSAGWIRGVGYHESVAGELDREAVDLLRRDVPVRIQHRSGSLWVVNSLAASALELDTADHAGIERDPAGVPTGRLWRCDAWLRARLAEPTALEAQLAAVSTDLSGYGVVGVTDATPDIDRSAESVVRHGVQQHVVFLGSDDPRVPRKIVVADHDLPALPVLAANMAAIRPRPIAVHCVTRAALVLTLAALGEIGPVRGDRIEHAAVVPRELLPRLRQLGVTVVSQPSLPLLRGDEYLDSVDAADVPVLWPVRSLLDAGIPVAFSSDAPYGSLDPWVSIAAATRRRTQSGRPIGVDERVPAATALDGYLTALGNPGGPARTVAAGQHADLVLLDSPLAEALAEPSSERIVATLIAGEFAHRR